MIDGELREYIGHRVKGAAKGTITELRFDESLGETVFVITLDDLTTLEVPTRESAIADLGLILY